MKKVFNWTLLAMMTLAMTSTVSSCKDDDDDSNNGTTTQVRDDVDPMDTEQVEVATRWISALTSTDVLDEGWEQQTYEPTLGRTSQNNALTRLVVVNDLDEARAEFASMANVDPKDLGSTKTVAMEGVGSLTWNPSAQGAENLATVSVDIKQVPHLQKIVYCTEEQTGSNGIFSKNVTGTAYYRFGDVVRDNEGYYWVCVRPSFEISDKGESHWVNIFNAAQEGNQKPILTKYIESKYDNKAKYKNQTLLLPTKLESDRKHLYSLSNLVWLLIDPSKYATYAANNGGKGLGGFPYQYNGTNFVTMVAQFWDSPADRGYNIWQLLFGYDRENMKKVERLNFFYKGYSWKWGDNITFWDYRTTGYLPEYFGNDDQDEIKMPWADGFDVNLLAGASGAKTGLGSGLARIANINGHKEGKWLVRVVTGDKLCLGGNYNPYNKLSGATDVYRFNEKTGKAPQSKLVIDTELQNQQQEAQGQALNEPHVGNIIGKDGKFYETTAAAAAASGEAVAMVTYLGGKYSVETGTDYNGLAMAISPVSQKAWSEDEVSDCGEEYDDRAKIAKVLNGISATDRLVDGCGKNHKHQAAMAARNYGLTLTADGKRAYSYSDWFLPSIGQWLLTLRGFGYHIDYADQGKNEEEKAYLGIFDEGSTNGYNARQEVLQAKQKIEATGMAWASNANTIVWTSTKYSDTQLHIAGFAYSRSVNVMNMFMSYSLTTIRTRPFIAFKYNGGGKEEWKSE